MTKTIIITGATSGIGKALAIHLAQAGHKVIATGRNKQALDELATTFPEQIIVATADITKTEGRQIIKQAIPSEVQSIYLVHNAGIATPTLLEDLTEQEWDQHYLVNTKAPAFLIKELLSYLKIGGRILNISTGLAHNTLHGFSAYGTSKAALYMLKEYCNKELAEEDIAFGSAMPGVVDTPIQKNIRNTDFPAADLFKGFNERGELLPPETVAKFLAWLLLDSTKEQFIEGDWDIYDSAHHQFWADVGEIKTRQQ